MAKPSIEDQLAALQQLRTACLPAEDLAQRLRPFLKPSNNLLVARAADLARESETRALVPELIAAFEHFLSPRGNAALIKADPQCWAKNALSKALHHLGCDRSELFLQGMRTHQYEPTWGGQSEVAGTLRANCAHALIDCHEITHQTLLLSLLELIADPDKAVRGEVLRAITQAGGESAILLLRMRALTAGKEEDAAVIGQCFAGLLSLEGIAAIPFVATFLTDQDDLGAEAAIALGESRTTEALAALLGRLQKPEASGGPHRGQTRHLESLLEPTFAAVLLSSIALTRQPDAIDKLLELIAAESSYAEAAIEALANAALSAEVQQRVAAVVAKVDSPRINRSYRQHFSS